MFEIGDIIVFEQPPGRARELDAGKRAVVDELVMDDEVLRAHQAADGGDVGQVAANETDGGIDAVETRDLFFERHMHRPLSGNEAARRGGDAKGADRIPRLGQHLRMAVEAEVVVGGEVDQLSAVDDGGRPGRGLVRAIERIGDAELLARELLGHHLLVFRQIFETGLLPARRRRHLPLRARHAVALGGLMRVPHPVQQVLLEAAGHLGCAWTVSVRAHWLCAFSFAVPTCRCASSLTILSSAGSASSLWSRLLTFS
ncbi:hypothetical protein D9M70_400240 [compost metagenome]